MYSVLQEKNIWYYYTSMDQINLVVQTVTSDNSCRDRAKGQREREREGDYHCSDLNSTDVWLVIICQQSGLLT